MNSLSMSLPHRLPGIDVAFGVKQCLGNTSLFSSLLHKFWEDYESTPESLHSREIPSTANLEMLHTLKGVATNLGMCDLTNLCHELQTELEDSKQLAEEAVTSLHNELEKIGGSIKTLDSLVQS